MARNIELISYNLTDLQQMEKLVRTNFVNSLTGFKSVCLIGTKSALGNTNLAIFSSIVHLGSHPPLIGMFTRPDSVDRHTLENILETGVYTLNHLTRSMTVKAHQTSARYPRDVSEFEAVGLKPTYLENFPAPFVEESAISIGLKLVETQRIRANNTILVIGEIQHVLLPEHCLGKDGFIDLELAGTLTCSGIDSYHATEQLMRLSYAKPNLEPRRIDLY
jgi:flavin reductase (DIM6/NTAB) family NADH-FMN oxidoreductase RutF